LFQGGLDIAGQDVHVLAQLARPVLVQEASANYAAAAAKGGEYENYSNPQHLSTHDSVSKPGGEATTLAPWQPA
jgi:hypothetical protein